MLSSLVDSIWDPGILGQGVRMRQHFSALRLFAAFGLVLVLVVAGAAAGPPTIASAPLVQDEDDGDEATGTATAREGYSARIAAGTCETLNADSAFPLTTAAPHGESPAGGVFVSETEVAVAVSDLLAEPHAIAIHAGEDDLQTALACGDVAGQAIDGRLIVALHDAENDDLVGIAVLDENEGATAVELYLIRSADSAIDDAGDAGDDAFDEDDADGGV
jgi:hypothetical protein